MPCLPQARHAAAASFRLRVWPGRVVPCPGAVQLLALAQDRSGVRLLLERSLWPVPGPDWRPPTRAKWGGESMEAWVF
eukprot:5376515-Pyramimonas_sp.AAC.1